MWYMTVLYFSAECVPVFVSEGVTVSQLLGPCIPVDPDESAGSCKALLPGDHHTRRSPRRDPDPSGRKRARLGRV